MLLWLIIIGMIVWLGIIPAVRGWQEGANISVPRHIRNRLRAEPKPTTHTNIEEEVTVEDMVMYDMMNQDDAFDIGVIDFNE